MNRKIGLYSSIINVAAVACFALSMLIGSNFGGYLSSMFIALSFVPMICAYTYFSTKEGMLAGIIAVSFAVVYATIICIVYFTQMTTVRAGGLSEQSMELLDYKYFGLFFNYDMLGYAMMALSTFFAGLTIEVKSRADLWLKRLLLIHGIFFISCLIIPMLGVFSRSTGGNDRIGVAILEFWCVYFLPIGILSYRHFLAVEDTKHTIK